MERAMRPTRPETKPMSPATDEGRPDDSADVLIAMIERMSAEQAACAKLGDPALAQRATRKVLTAVACAADAVLADANTLHSAPDKLGAFFDKSATACVAAIEGLHKRADLNEAANEFAPGRPRAGDPRRGDYAPWGPPKTS
jgi:hypothetical protein